MTRFLELAAEVEYLGKTDARLDAEIWCAVFAPAEAYVEQSKFNGAWCIFGFPEYRVDIVLIHFYYAPE